jgi:hypothetical protein
VKEFMKLQKILTLSALLFSCAITHANPAEHLNKSLDSLQRMNTQSLSQTDQLLLEVAIDNVKLALSDLQSVDPKQQIIKDLQAAQGLVGSMIAAPGDVFSRGPTLKNVVTITVSVDYCRILKLVFGIDAVIGTTIRFNSSDEVAAKYNSMRAEYMSLLGQAIATLGEEGRPIIGASLTWGRGMYVLSQPDCINIAGWSYQNQCT